MNPELVKQQMANAYSEKARDYGVVRNSKFDAFLKTEVQHFVALVKPVGNIVLDIGSGPGNEGVRLRDAGLKPVCIDNAPGMVTECLNKGLEAYVMDFYKLKFADDSFSGAWMAFSLLHVPKDQAGAVIKEASRVLATNGIFYVSLFEGEGEGLRTEDLSRFGCERYFAYYSQKEITKLLLPYFKVITASRLDISPRPTISFICSKL